MRTSLERVPDCKVGVAAPPLLIIHDTQEKIHQEYII